MALMNKKDFQKERKVMKGFQALGVVTALMTITACSPRIDYRGKNPEPKELKQIHPGLHQEEVLNLIGSPTFETIYGAKKWFYVYKKTETTSFLDPKTIEKNTISISFNDQGIVEKVEDLDPATAQDIDPIRHKTKTVGEDRPFLQQVFSNFGRVARKESGKK